MANLIRLKQLDQLDLSGFFNDAYVNTGYVNEAFVHKYGDETISGIKTFIDGVNFNNIDNLNLSGIDINIQNGNVTLGQNLNVSGDLNVAGTIKYNQIIDTTVTGNLSGYTGIFTTVFANNLVYNTGNQTINGNLTLSGNNSPSFLKMYDSAHDLIGGISLADKDYVFYSDINSPLTSIALRPNPQNIDDRTIAHNSVVVHKIDIDETISGVKTFTNSGIFSLSKMTPLSLPSNPLSIVGSGNTYIQVNIQNRATGKFATSDLVLTANNGTDTSNYIDLGINNSGYNDPTFSNGNQFDGYLFVQGGSLDIATTPVDSAIEFHAEGTTADKVIARINRSGLSIITGSIFIAGKSITAELTSLSGALNSTGSNILTAISSLSGSLNSTGSNILTAISSLSGQTVFVTGNQLISGNKTFANSGIFASSAALPLSLPTNPLAIVGSGNTYVQVNIQNRATGTTATADLVITANNGTDASNYIDLGINNSGYNDPAFSNGGQYDGYLFVQGGSLDIGTQTANTNIEFHAGGTTADKTIVRINESGFNLISGSLSISNSYLSGEKIKPNSGIALYNRSSNARQILTQVGPEGRSIAFQPSFVSNRVIFYQPRPSSVSFTNTNTNLNLNANTFSGGVTVARPTYLQTNDMLGHMPRIGFQHTGGFFDAGFSNNVEPTTFRGTGGFGGFFFQTRFAISENKIGTSGKGFFGLWDKQTVAATISNPGGVINTPYGSDRQNIIGVGFNSGDSNLSFIHADNINPGVDDVNRKKVSLGSNFPISSGNIYEFSMYALPDQPYVDMTISILKSGIFSGYRATTALPPVDSGLSPNFSINGPNIAGNIAFDLCAFYLDTPY